MKNQRSENPAVTEDVIRDELSKRLHLLESGLTLADVEYYLPSENGARGFVDIVGRDMHGKLVLIELKRSTARSREAIQELLKYVGLFVEIHGLRRSQIRCMVVSTSWHELSTPFAEIVQSEAFQFEGYHLKIQSDGIPIEAIQVDPTPAEEVTLHQPYLMHCYETAEQRDVVSAAVLRFIQAKPGADSLIIHEDYRGSNPDIVYPFSFILCVASMTRGGSEEYDNDDIGPEWELINSAVEAAPWFAHDFAARGAFQFVADMNNGWKPVRWLRTGRFENVDVWTDGDLISLVSGFESHNGMYLRFVSTPKNRIDWRQRLGQIAEFFQPDLDLCETVTAILKEFATTYPKGTVGLSAFYPEDLLLAVCGSVLRKQDDLTPEIVMTLVPPDSSLGRIKVVRFMLCWDETTRPKDAAATIKAIYRTEMGYQLASVMHEHFGYRAKTLHVLGLNWQSFETTADNKNGQQVVLSDGQLVRHPLRRNSVVWLRPFAVANWDWICDLASVVDPQQKILSQ